MITRTHRLVANVVPVIAILCVALVLMALLLLVTGHPVAPALAALWRGAFGSWSLLFWVSVFGAPVLLAIALALGEPVWPQAWGPIVGLFVLSQLVGQGLMVFALRYFPPLVVGLALLTQPVVASIYGWLAFGEVLSGTDIVGMVLVGAALAVARAKA